MCLSLAKMVPLAGLQDHTCTKTIHSIHQMCQALAKMVPLVGLQDHTCTKTIHSMHQMCLAMAKKNGTTGRAPRPHVYQDHTQYASDVSGYGKKMVPLAGLQDDTCTKTIYSMHQMCLAMAKNGTTGRASWWHMYQGHTQYTSDVSGYGKKYHWQGSNVTCVPRPYIMYV